MNKINILIVVGVVFVVGVVLCIRLTEAVIAWPGGGAIGGANVELRAQSCAANNNSAAAGTYGSACRSAGYPGTCGYTGDRLSCDDYPINETESAGSGNWAGVKVTVFNSSITDCASITQVYACYNWWASGGTASAAAVTISNGTTSKNISTADPGTTVNPATTCVNVTTNLTWTCGNFFGASGSRAYISDNFERNALRIVYTDLLVYNVTYTYTAVYPTFSGDWNNNGSLLGNGPGLFNVTLNNTNGTVWLEINSVNVTAKNLSANVYNASYTFSSGGVYTYRWHSWGNGSWKDYNKSSDISYTVNVSSTCAYSGSGNWFVTCSDSCTVSANTALGNNNVTITGNGGRFLLNANITNFNYFKILGGCNVTCTQAGCITMN